MTLRLAALGLCFALLVGAGGGAVCAQQQRVRAYIEPAAIDDSTRIQYVIEIQDLGGGQVEPPPLPRKLPNLRVIGGPSRNSQFSWIQGRASSTYSLIYTLIPDGPGPAEIPSIVVKVDGRPYRTETIRFEVAKSQAPPPRTPSAPRTQPTQPADNADVFLRAELGTDRVWVGQPVTLTVKLFTAAQISQPRWVPPLPNLGNFWVENIEVNDEQYRTRSGGHSYTVLPADRKVLIPSTSGEFTIEPYVAEMEVRIAGGGDVFQRWFGRTQTIVRKSNPLQLSVRELPAGAPEDFGGAVGSFKIRAALDRTDAAVDDAVALRVTVDGEGSLRSVGPPTVQAPADLRLFEPRVTDSFDLAGGKLRSKKSWEWIVVPLAPGKLRLPEIGFTFFNPATERYETARTESILLAVNKSERPDDRPKPRGGIQAQRRDLAFVKLLRGTLEQDYPRAHQRALFMTLLLLPLLWMPLVVLIGRQRARLQRDQGLARSRRARARARKRLRTARRNLGQTDSAAFHEEVARALVEYIADRFNRAATGLTYDVADELLASRAVDAELRREFRGCLETCDFARFVPAAGETERREETLLQADALVERLERAL